MSDAPPEFPSRTTFSTPAASRSQRTPTPMSTSGVLEDEVVAVAREASVPTEEPVAASGDEGGQVVLAEVGVVVRRDQCGLGAKSRGVVVDAPAGSGSVRCTSAGGRRLRHEYPRSRSFAPAFASNPPRSAAAPYVSGAPSNDRTRIGCRRKGSNGCDVAAPHRARVQGSRRDASVLPRRARPQARPYRVASGAEGRAGDPLLLRLGGRQPLGVLRPARRGRA